MMNQKHSLGDYPMIRRATEEHFEQKHDSNKAAAMYLHWNHISVWVLPLPGAEYTLKNS